MPNGLRLDQGYPSIDRSNALFARSQGLIPAHTQTLAKGPTQYVQGVAPKYLERGRGAHVWDVDGNEYVDLTMAVGPLVLGYGNPAVDRAIVDQLGRGIVFSLVHPLEVEVSELVRELVPNAEMVRFSKTGCDVTSAAIRLARAFTGRDRVLTCGYHGWHDWTIATSPRNLGIPEAVKGLTQTIPYNGVEQAISAIDASVAAVILEPVIFEEPQHDVLGELRRACDRTGTLLVFDEMWTGFRVALGGAQERYEVRADLATFSKAVANGMPLSVLTGRREVMRLLENDVFFFTTFGGEALSLAAAKATLTELRERDVPTFLEVQGKKLQDGYNALAGRLGLDFTRCIGLPCRSMVVFDERAGDPLLLKSLVQQELVRQGVLFAGFHNLSYAHTDADVAHVLAAYEGALSTLAKAVREDSVAAQLRGEPVQPVFRKTR